jgi:hypothetical protein
MTGLRTHMTTKVINRTLVVNAYASSLRVTFVSAIAAFVMVNILIATIQLPHLGRKDSTEETAEDVSSTS